MTARTPRSDDPGSRRRSSRGGGRSRSSKSADPRAQEWIREQEDRIALIEERSREESTGAFRAPAGDRAGRNFDPGAPSRYRRLRAVSRFLLLCGYLLLGGMLAGIGVTAWLWREGSLGGDGWFALGLIGWLFVGGFSFALFKFLAELSWSLADLGDQQLDSRNLLIDLRDESERARRS